MGTHSSSFALAGCSGTALNSDYDFSDKHIDILKEFALKICCQTICKPGIFVFVFDLFILLARI